MLLPLEPVIAIIGLLVFCAKTSISPIIGILLKADSHGDFNDIPGLRIILVILFIILFGKTNL